MTGDQISPVFVMSKKINHQLSQETKEELAKQLAGFFFGYWNGRYATQKQKPKRKGQVVASELGLLRSFPNAQGNDLAFSLQNNSSRSGRGLKE